MRMTMQVQRPLSAEPATVMTTRKNPALNSAEASRMVIVRLSAIYTMWVPTRGPWRSSLKVEEHLSEFTLLPVSPAVASRRARARARLRCVVATCVMRGAREG